MCVWNPGDQNELAEDASDKEWVVGYSVGHDRLGSAYTSARGDQACPPASGDSYPFPAPGALLAGQAV